MNKSPYKILLLLTILLIVSFSKAQGTKAMKWYCPTTEKHPIVHQQLWCGKEIGSFYDRLPGIAEQVVRPEVWNLSRNAAGLKLVFRTDAEKITVRYAVSKKSYAMNHFPATGVSGLDLFAENADGSWAWANGRYSFKDTITYTYEDVGQDREQYEDGRTFHLYLPLYNSLQWLEIGVPSSNTFEFVPVSAEKPIVVYGTSIAQGGCASRPGMAWTNTLNRKLNIPVVNLGFSNNGRLEKEVVDLIAEKDAAVFILDCLPNMMLQTQNIKSGTTYAVGALRERHPHTPIVLVDHSHYLEGIMNRGRRERILKVNKLVYEAYEELLENGVEGLYYLKNEDIGLNMDDSVIRTQSAVEAADHASYYRYRKNWKDRLEIAAYLNSVAFNYPLQSPIDRIKQNLRLLLYFKIWEDVLFKPSSVLLPMLSGILSGSYLSAV